MPTPILATKLYIPLRRPKVVLRPRLVAQLNEGLHRKLILISAAAGFGKTTLVAEWVNQQDEAGEAAIHPARVAWLSLDEGDNDLIRFLTYFVAALQTITGKLGSGVLGMLQSPQPPSIETILTALLNDIIIIPDNFVLVLDDYHVIDAKPIDRALTFLLDHLPPQMHLVIATREDPNLPLARLRARDQLTELRVTDLRFTAAEAASFLNRVMGLNLSAEEIAALETRTEGWIAGLQFASLALQGTLSRQGHQATGDKAITSFIKSFTGSHHFVLDYLVEEVLSQQPAHIQTFLLRTSILNSLCGPLCDAVVGDLKLASGEFVDSRSQIILEHLEHANLFTIPLDNERRWYRYHHLFADLLRQRLHQSLAASPVDAESRVNELHIRASQWYEDNGLELEAFHHAAGAHDIERAERLIEGRGIPLHFRGAVTTILNWFESLPMSVLNARPSLWWRYASLLLVNGQTTGVEEKLQAAEDALPSTEADDQTRLLIGRIAAARAVLALTRYQIETMMTQSRRALEYLPPDNLFLRANATWTLGYAYLFAGNRAAARQTLTEAISLSQAARDIFTTLLATIGLGNVQEAENQLYLAAETYRRVLQLTGDQPLQIIYEAHLGLARVLYEWNDLEAAEQHGRQSLHLARQYDKVIDRFIICEVFLARLKLAQGDVDGAEALLAQSALAVRQQNFVYRMPEVAAAQVLTLLHKGNSADTLLTAAHLAQTHELPMSQARVHLAQGDTTTALTVLEPLRRQMEAKQWEDERLKVMVLQAVAHQAQGEQGKAMQWLGDALALAEPSGFIRTFLDEGLPMAALLTRLKDKGSRMNAYIHKLLAAFGQPAALSPATPQPAAFVPQPLVEPLSQRELEVLQLIAQGLSNQAISERLFLALSSVKGHNLKIFGKLQVQRRTEAVARARELGLLPTSG